MVNSGFRSLLSVMLPSVEQRAMLEASLADRENAYGAWTAWQNDFGGPERLLAAGPDGVKRLLPTFWNTLRHTEIGLPALTKTRLRTAYAREQLRSQTYRTICQAAFKALSQADVSFVVLKGASLAECEYAEPALRHCHDCDLWVRRVDQPRAVQALQEVGFTGTLGGSESVATHETGLPVVMHAELFRNPYYTPPADEIWARTERREVCGVDTNVLAPPDALLHVLGHASSSPTRFTLVWVCDSIYIIRKHPELDWSVMVGTAIQSKLALPVSVLLDYLATAHRAPVPQNSLTRLRDAAETAGMGACEAALFGVAAVSRRDTVYELFKRARGLTQYVALMKWLMFPAPSQVRWKYGLPSGWRLPWTYVVRPFRGIFFRVRRRLSG